MYKLINHCEYAVKNAAFNMSYCFTAVLKIATADFCLDGA